MEPTQIQLELARGEADVLHEQLESLLRETRVELTHTDDRRYRQVVHDRLDTLEAIQAKLHALLER